MSGNDFRRRRSLRWRGVMTEEGGGWGTGCRLLPDLKPSPRSVFSMDSTSSAVHKRMPALPTGPTRTTPNINVPAALVGVGHGAGGEEVQRNPRRRTNKINALTLRTPRASLPPRAHLPHQRVRRGDTGSHLGIHGLLANCIEEQPRVLPIGGVSRG